MTTTRYPTELDRLKDLIVEAELQHRQAVREWEALAEPICDRIDRAQAEWDATAEPATLKALHVARRDLTDLGPCPVEPLRLGMLRGRLHRLENER